MIEIPTNKTFESDYDKVVADVLNQLTTGQDKNGEGCVGTAYVDWGVGGVRYKNCPSKSIADMVARDFKAKGYYVYIQRMGYGSRSISSGTPICYRIHQTARAYNNWDLL